MLDQPFSIDDDASWACSRRDLLAGDVGAMGRLGPALGAISSLLIAAADRGL